MKNICIPLTFSLSLIFSVELSSQQYLFQYAEIADSTLTNDEHEIIDRFEKYIANQPHDSGLDGPGQVAYLCLTGEHAARGLVLNRFEKSVQKIGG